MSENNLYKNTQFAEDGRSRPDDEVMLTVVPEPSQEVQPPPPPPKRRVFLPLFLFIATCVSTYLVGGPIYALCVMTILVCHEAGHFVQTLRYGVYSSLPFFIPVPLEPIGTMGAVIGMSANIPNRRALFDIGISGPLAGLVPTVIFCFLGLLYGSHVGPVVMDAEHRSFGEPLLFKLIVWWWFGEIPAGQTVFIGPMAVASWVGVFITALNLFPIGQLDGGHVLYALLQRKAHFVATFLLLTAIYLVIAFGQWEWSLMLGLLMLMGPRHPPTRDDHVPLGRTRVVLGWLTLAFVIIGFVPNPLPR